MFVIFHQELALLKRKDEIKDLTLMIACHGYVGPAPLAAAALVVEMLGPIVLGRALHAAQELPDTPEG